MLLRVPSSSDVNKALAGLENRLNNATRSSKDFTDSLALRAVNYTGYIAASSAVLRLTESIARATNDALRFQVEIAKLAQTFNRSIDSLDSYSDSIRNISTSYGLSAPKIAEVVRVLGQAGFSFKNALSAAEDLSKTTLLASFENLTDTTDGLIAVNKQFADTVGQSTRVLALFNTVSKAYAVEAGDLVEAVRKAGGVFSVTGGSLEELVTLITVVRDTTRESASEIATGFRTIFSRIQRSETIDYFRSLGIELTDLKGNFIGNFEAIQRIQEGLDRAGIAAGSIKFAEVIEQLGGIRQASRVIPLLTQGAKIQQVWGKVTQANTEFSEDLSKAQQTLSFQLAQTQQNFSKLIGDIAETKSFKLLAETVLTSANALIKLADAFKEVIPLFATFAAFRIGKSLIGNLRTTFGGGGIPPIKRNRGGIVPGSGHGDTVPAMLTPGEFVIRKSAVQAIGIDKLSQINRYGYGGTVRQLSESYKSIKTLRGFDAVADKKLNYQPNYVNVIPNEADLNYFHSMRGPYGHRFEKVLAKSRRFNTGRPSSYPFAYIDFPETNSEAKFMPKGKTYNQNDPDNLKGATDATMAAKALLFYASKRQNKRTPGMRLSLSAIKKAPKLTTYVTDPSLWAKKADGGSITGPDTVPALLTPGEFVINKKSAQSFGYGNLKKINRYNRGGVVGGVQKFFVGGVAEKNVSRTSGYVEYDNIQQAADDMAEILSQLGPDVAAKIKKGFAGIENVAAGASASFGGSKFSDTQRGAAVFSSSGTTGIGLQIKGDRAAANTNTLSHETGHVADRALSGGKGFASQTKGTFQFDLIEKIKPVMEAAFLRAGHSAEQIQKYLASNEELFAEFFAKATPEVRNIITSTTDAKAGMLALKQHLEKAGHTYAGLEAADIDIDGQKPAKPAKPAKTKGGRSPAGRKPFIATSLPNQPPVATPVAEPTATAASPKADPATSLGAGAVATALANIAQRFVDTESAAGRMANQFLELVSYAGIAAESLEFLGIDINQAKIADTLKSELSRIGGKAKSVVENVTGVTKAKEQRAYANKQLEEVSSQKSENEKAIGPLKAQIAAAESEIATSEQLISKKQKLTKEIAVLSKSINENEKNTAELSAKEKAASEALSKTDDRIKKLNDLKMEGGLGARGKAELRSLEQQRVTQAEESASIQNQLAGSLETGDQLKASKQAKVTEAAETKAELKSKGVNLRGKRQELEAKRGELSGRIELGKDLKARQSGLMQTAKGKLPTVGGRISQIAGKIPGVGKALGSFNLGGLIGSAKSFAGAAKALGGKVLGVAGTVSMLGGIIDQGLGYEQKKNRAIESGNVAEAESAAQSELTASNVTMLSSAVGGALSAIPAIGPILGGVAGFGIKLASLVPGLDTAIGGVANFSRGVLESAGLVESSASIIGRAGLAASVNNFASVFEKNSGGIARSTRELEAGIMSPADFLSSSEVKGNTAAAALVAQKTSAQNANLRREQEANANMGGLAATGKYLASFFGGETQEETAIRLQKEIEANNQQSIDVQKQNLAALAPGLNASMEAALRAGQTFDQWVVGLEDGIEAQLRNTKEIKDYETNAKILKAQLAAETAERERARQVMADELAVMQQRMAAEQRLSKVLQSFEMAASDSSAALSQLRRRLNDTEISAPEAVATQDDISNIKNRESFDAVLRTVGNVKNAEGNSAFGEQIAEIQKAESLVRAVPEITKSVTSSGRPFANIQEEFVRIDAAGGPSVAANKQKIAAEKTAGLNATLTSLGVDPALAKDTINAINEAIVSSGGQIDERQITEILKQKLGESGQAALNVINESYGRIVEAAGNYSEALNLQASAVEEHNKKILAAYEDQVDYQNRLSKARGEEIVIYDKKGKPLRTAAAETAAAPLQALQQSSQKQAAILSQAGLDTNIGAQYGFRKNLIVGGETGYGAEISNLQQKIDEQKNKIQQASATGQTGNLKGLMDEQNKYIGQLKALQTAQQENIGALKSQRDALIAVAEAERQKVQQIQDEALGETEKSFEERQKGFRTQADLENVLTGKIKPEDLTTASLDQLGSRIQNGEELSKAGKLTPQGQKQLEALRNQYETKQDRINRVKGALEKSDDPRAQKILKAAAIQQKEVDFNFAKAQGASPERLKELRDEIDALKNGNTAEGAAALAQSQQLNAIVQGEESDALVNSQQKLDQFALSVQKAAEALDKLSGAKSLDKPVEAPKTQPVQELEAKVKAEEEKRIRKNDELAGITQSVIADPKKAQQLTRGAKEEAEAKLATAQGRLKSGEINQEQFNAEQAAIETEKNERLDAINKGKSGTQNVPAVSNNVAAATAALSTVPALPAPVATVSPAATPVATVMRSPSQIPIVGTKLRANDLTPERKARIQANKSASAELGNLHSKFRAGDITKEEFNKGKVEIESRRRKAAKEISSGGITYAGNPRNANQQVQTATEMPNFSQLAEALQPFNDTVKQLIAMPKQIDVKINDVSVSVNHNGQEIFMTLNAEFQKLINQNIVSAFTNYENNKKSGTPALAGIVQPSTKGTA